VSGRRDGRQLPLALEPVPALGREDFLVGAPNRTAAEAIDRWPDWPSPLALLVGPPGSGKSHLAGAWAARADGRVVAAADLAAEDPIALARRRAVAVEDADRAVADVALFHLLNAAQAEGASVLVTARGGLDTWRPMLPDVESRLRAGLRLAIAEPDDELLAKVLIKLFADRQLAADPAVVDYLVTRMERSLAAANALVAAIDSAALAGRRAVTRPLAAAVLEAARPAEDG